MSNGFPRYCIVERPAPGDYQGLDRPPPGWGDDDRINAVLDAVASWDESPPSYEEAVAACQALEAAGLPVQLLIDVPQALGPPPGSTFLGYDVTILAYHSMLRPAAFRGLQDTRSPEEEPLAPFCDVVHAHFGPLRNERGLFPSADVAERFAGCLRAMKLLVPGAFDDYGRCEIEVHQLYGLDFGPGIDPTLAR